MSGVRGAGGPVPKRSEQRRRVNKPAKGAPEKVEGAAKVGRLPANRSWHRAARQWYDALGRSGQAQFYQDADWATAWAAAEALSRELNPKPMVVGRGDFARVEMVEQPVTAAAMQSFLKACTALLATEGDRRRAAIELQRPTGDKGEAAANVSFLDVARRTIGGAG